MVEGVCGGGGWLSLWDQTTTSGAVLNTSSITSFWRQVLSLSWLELTEKADLSGQRTLGLHPLVSGSAGITSKSPHSRYFFQESSHGLQALVLEGEHFADPIISPGLQVCSCLTLPVPISSTGSKGGSCSAIWTDKGIGAKRGNHLVNRDGKPKWIYILQTSGN